MDTRIILHLPQIGVTEHHNVFLRHTKELLSEQIVSATESQMMAGPCVQ